MLFKSVSKQLIILSKLDRLIWQSSTPIALILDPLATRQFFEGLIFVSHLKNHETKNQAIIFSPESEKGVIHSLAEALSAMFKDVDEEKLYQQAPALWRQHWQSELNDPNNPHRLLIVDQFEEVLNVPFEERLEFCQILCHLATEKRLSVLFVTNQEYSGYLHSLPSFQSIDPEGPIVQQLNYEPKQLPPLSGVKNQPTQTEQTGNRIPTMELAFTSIVSILMLSAICAILFQFPWSGSAKYQQVQQNSLAYQSSLYTEFGKSHKTTPLKPVFKDAIVEEKSIAAKLDIEVAPRPEPPPKKQQQIQTKLVSKPEPKVPFTLNELLSEYKQLKLMHSATGLSETIQFVNRVFPNRDCSGLQQWVEEAESNPLTRELKIAKKFIAIGDRETAYLLYLQNAKKTSDPEVLYKVGLCQLFGDGTQTNTTAAITHFIEASKAGHADSVFLHGLAQLNGIGGQKKDLYDAYKTLEKAMELGSKRPLYELGRMQELGIGRTPNLYWAVHLYNQGAESGDPACIQQLIKVYQSNPKKFTNPKQLVSDLKRQLETTEGDLELKKIRQKILAEVQSPVTQ